MFLLIDGKVYLYSAGLTKVQLYPCLTNILGIYLQMLVSQYIYFREKNIQSNNRLQYNLLSGTLRRLLPLTSVSANIFKMINTLKVNKIISYVWYAKCLRVDKLTIK